MHKQTWGIGGSFAKAQVEWWLVFTRMTITIQRSDGLSPKYSIVRESIINIKMRYLPGPLPPVSCRATSLHTTRHGFLLAVCTCLLLFHSEVCSSHLQVTASHVKSYHGNQPTKTTSPLFTKHNECALRRLIGVINSKKFVLQF